MLAKRRDLRPQSALELEQELTALLPIGDRHEDLARLASVRKERKAESPASDRPPSLDSVQAQVPDERTDTDVLERASGESPRVRPLAEVDGFTAAISLPLERREEAKSVLSRTTLSRPTFERTKVFICYRQEDSSDVSGRIHDHLVGALGSDSVFKDVDSIPLGANFKTYLENVVNSCLLQIVVIGRQWLDVRDETGERRLDDASDWVRIEIEAALARDIPIIPLLVQGASMPKPSHLPPSLQELAYLHGAAIRRDPGFRDDMQRLIGSLGTLLSRFAG